MKLDPNNGDAMSSVGDDFGSESYIGMVGEIDGCVYGIPRYSKHIPKYDPINNTTSFVGEEADCYYDCKENGALGRDGCIYVLVEGGRVLKIDTIHNSHGFVGNSLESDHDNGWGFCDVILGIDGCIYWAPYNNSRTLKYKPHSNQTSLLADDFGRQRAKWSSGGGALATDGVIYCIPASANQVLAIDPLGEFSVATKTNMEEHPEELGFLFRTNANNTASNRTDFDAAIAKFGIQKVLAIMQEHVPSSNEVCGVSNLYPFMIAASYEESPLSVVYFLLCEVPSLINCNSNRVVGNANLKRNCSTTPRT